MAMFDNIKSWEAGGERQWLCSLDEPYNGSHIAYAGSFIDGVPDTVTGAEEYWF